MSSIREALEAAGIPFERPKPSETYECLKPRVPTFAKFRKLNDEAVLAIRHACERGERQVDIAERFGVHRSVVSRIWTGDLHANVGRSAA